MRVTARVSHVAPIMIILFFPLVSLYAKLAFIIHACMLHLQSSSVLNALIARHFFPLYCVYTKCSLFPNWKWKSGFVLKILDFSIIHIIRSMKFTVFFMIGISSSRVKKTQQSSYPFTKPCMFHETGRVSSRREPDQK